jgi:aminomethyltransferase
MSETSLKRTPLFDWHRKLGARIVEFGGWEMPVQYTSIMEEHQAVRSAAGLFDISHMGEVRVAGPRAEWFLNHTLTNDARKLAPGQGQYTLMCQDQGGVIDDLYAYRLAESEFLLIINASRIEPDVAWLQKQAAAVGDPGALELRDQSAEQGAVAVQGPRVKEFIDQCFSGPSRGGKRVAWPSELIKNEVARFGFDGQEVWVSRTGYTGEDGFEAVAAAGLIASVWAKVLETGRPHGLVPAGLGARDTLRTEVCYPLYGHELDEQTTPIEAGLGFFVAMEKGEFNGRPVLAGQKASGVAKKCVAFKMTDKSAPPRPHYPLWSVGDDARLIGQVVSGTQSPSLGIGIGMGYVKPEFSKPGSALAVEIRGRRFPAVVAPRPLYRKAV